MSWDGIIIEKAFSQSSGKQQQHQQQQQLDSLAVSIHLDL